MSLSSVASKKVKAIKCKLILLDIHLQFLSIQRISLSLKGLTNLPERAKEMLE